MPTLATPTPVKRASSSSCLRGSRLIAWLWSPSIMPRKIDTNGELNCNLCGKALWGYCHTRKDRRTWADREQLICYQYTIHINCLSDWGRWPKNPVVWPAKCNTFQPGCLGVWAYVGSVFSTAHCPKCTSAKKNWYKANSLLSHCPLLRNQNRNFIVWRKTNEKVFFNLSLKNSYALPLEITTVDRQPS